MSRHHQFAGPTKEETQQGGDLKERSGLLKAPVLLFFFSFLLFFFRFFSFDNILD